MTSFYFPVVLTVVGMLFYHLAQKSVPKDSNPFVALIIAYSVGIVLLAICGLIYPSKKSFIDSVRESNWVVLLLGVGAASIELGFLLSYRAGWKISVTGIATNVAATVLLIPIGIFLFKDQLSLRNILGLIFCVLGLVLVVRD
jgi:drug/metabolite transporter (DMT)-like permease